MSNVPAVRLIAAGVVTLTSLWPYARIQRDVGPSSRAEATQIVAEMRRIVTTVGIERREKVRIGGIDQWISVRGFDRRNPILLYIHGGPGFPAMPTSWFYQRGWEEYFTVVQWDQRGAGKTYLANDPEVVGPTMTPQRMIADAEEMIGWLRREFDKKKIFVLGHSWGSYVGLDIARRHPQWLHAYIGMGQITDSMESERRGWRFAMDHARRANNEQAVRELQSIAGYAQGNKLLEWKDVELQRKWLGFFGGAVHGRQRFDHEIVGTALAPEYSDADVQSIWVASDFSEERLLPTVLTTDFGSVTTLECPMILFNGRHDYNVSASVAAEWFERLQAPSKTLVWFERSAHDIVNEEPGKVLLSLVQYARPIAERAGDVPPS
jgi:pimeloyl-ACP methyl ester carboxylesterase